MQRPLISLFLASALCGLAAPASAQDDTVVYKARVICDNDGDGDFSDTTGRVTLYDAGDLRVSIPGLAANTMYRVVLACQVGAKLVFADLTTNNNGKLSGLITGLGRSGPLATGCALPTVNAFPLSGAGFCYAGYGQP